MVRLHFISLIPAFAKLSKCRSSVRFPAVCKELLRCNRTLLGDLLLTKSALIIALRSRNLQPTFKYLGKYKKYGPHLDGSSASRNAIKLCCRHPSQVQRSSSQQRGEIASSDTLKWYWKATASEYNFGASNHAVIIPLLAVQCSTACLRLGIHNAREHSLSPHQWGPRG